MLDTTRKPAARPRHLRTRSRRPSEIERLHAKSKSLMIEFDMLDRAAGKIPKESLLRFSLEQRRDEVNEQDDAIRDLLTFERPGSLREIGILLNVLSFHVMSISADEEPSKASEEKALRIIEAIKDSLPNMPEVQGGIAVSSVTDALLAEAATLMNGGVPDLTLVAA